MIQLCRHFRSHLECQTVTCQVRKHVRDGHRKYDRSGARALFVRLLSKERDHEKSEKQQEQGLEDEEQKGGHELESPPSPPPGSPGKPAAGSEELGKQPMTESMTMGRRLRGRPLSPFQRVTGFMPPDFWKSKAADLGEPIMAELKEQKEVQHFRKMWILDERRKVNSKYGMVLFEDIIGKNPGDTYVTSTGTEMIIRRPSLEEFTLYMKKIAAIPHPKNNNTALCLLDVSPGDWVLECGTGSGAMTLFLSRAVGVTGRVISFEIKQDHLNRAKRNYRLWIDSWKLSHETDWPDNVTFHHADVINATDKVRHQLDGAFLDMLTPNIGLRAVLPLIKPGKVIACHIVNMTQVVDLVASILKHQLPVVVEQVLEVEHKNWLVTPAQHYTGRLINKPGSPSHGEVSSDEEQGSSSEEEGNGGQITEDTAFLARPAIKQDSHTGFLMKLRVYSDTKHARCTT
ncbi:tRNA methyltransferase 61 B [Branchiostoma belcheri]|nr:tRNA methyltransferase 61 B [Branchiostoma belcheri]